MLNAGGNVLLGFTLEAQDAMSGILDKATAAVARLREGLGKLDAISMRAQAGLATLGLSLFNAGRGFLEGAFDLAAKVGGPFEEAMQQAQYWTGATEDQFRDMHEAVFSAKNALLGFNATDAAKALQDLSRETGNAREALDQLEPALLLAGITSRSAEAGAKQLHQTLRVFAIEGKDAGETVDRIAVAAKLFHTPAGEMADAIGRTARGAKVMGASMTDAAVTMGILKSGSRSLGESAMMRMGNAKVSAALEKIAPGAKNADGSLRPLPAVLGLIADNTLKLTETEQKNALTKAFGARAAGDMLRSMKDLAKGIDDGQGHLLKGSEAVKYLYEQMQNSEGAARKMRDAMLDNFLGQEKVMKAAIESLKTGIAGPLASALKPVVALFADATAKAVEFFAKIDPKTKTFIAQAVLLAGVLVTVLGAAFVFLGGPATLAVLALVAAGAALYEAYQTNLGGFADWVHDTFDRVALAFRALSSLFSKGGLSLDLFDALQKDPALMNFVLNVYVWVQRAINFFKGLGEGFAAGIQRVKPHFDAFVASLEKLAAKFGIVVGAVDPIANGNAFTGAGEQGRSLGEKLADVAGIVADLAGKVADVIGGIVDFGRMLDNNVGIVNLFKGALAALAAVKLAQAAAGVAEFGKALLTANPYVLAATAAVIALTAAYTRFHELEEKYGKGKGMAAWWMNAKHNLGITSDAEYWKQRDEMGGKGDARDQPGTYAYAHRMEKAFGGPGVPGVDLPPAPPSTPVPVEPLASMPPPAEPLASMPPPESPVPASMPAVAAAEPPAEAVGPLQSVADAVRAVADRPIVVESRSTLVCDGEVLTTIVERHQASQADRSGVPVAPPP
jgi:TP901 family phage tail tape measure protein